jgi:hypothetical protein
MMIATIGAFLMLVAFLGGDEHPERWIGGKAGDEENWFVKRDRLVQECRDKLIEEYGLKVLPLSWKNYEGLTVTVVIGEQRYLNVSVEAVEDPKYMKLLLERVDST